VKTEWDPLQIPLVFDILTTSIRFSDIVFELIFNNVHIISFVVKFA
jgi:hypothetical protein